MFNSWPDHDSLQVYLTLLQLAATALGTIVAAGFGLLIRITRNSFVSLQASVESNAKETTREFSYLRERLARVEQASGLPAPADRVNR